MTRIIRAPIGEAEQAAIELLVSSGVLSVGVIPKPGAPRAPRAPRACEQCGEQFMSQTKAAKYCSRACNGAAKRGSGATVAILDALRTRYPCEALPFGALTSLGVEFGVTMERVRQVAVAHGFAGPGRGSRHAPHRVCASCGMPMWNKAKSAVCRACGWIDVSCEQCGKPKRVPASRIASNINRAPTLVPSGTMASYTGRVFCDRHCFGRWLGEHHGWGARKAKRLAAEAANARS